MSPAEKERYDMRERPYKDSSARARGQTRMAVQKGALNEIMEPEAARAVYLRKSKEFGRMVKKAKKKTADVFSGKARSSKFSGDPHAVKAKKPVGRLSQRIKELRGLMDRHDELSARLKPVAEAIAKTRDRILNDFTTDEIGTTTAHGLRVTKKRHSSPVVKDARKFFRYATKNPKNWDLLQKTCNSAGWRARVNDGVAVPGVQSFTSVGVSVERV